MNKKVKKLVELSFVDGKIDNKVAGYVLSHLSKKELKAYLKILRHRIEARRVVIASASVLNSAEKKKMSKIFADYDIEFEQNLEIGGGMKVMVGDTIIDLSVKNYIETILANLS